MNNIVKKIFVSRMILWISIIMISIGIVQVFFIGLSTMDVANDLYCKKMNNLCEQFIILSKIGFIALFIGFCLSLINEKKRYLSEEHLSKKGFFKEALCQMLGWKDEKILLLQFFSLKKYEIPKQVKNIYFKTTLISQ